MSLRSSLNEGGDSQFEARGAVTPTFVARNSAPVHAALCRVVDSFDGTGSPTSVDSDGLPRRAASDDYFSRSRARPWEVKIASHVGSDLTFWRAEVRLPAAETCSWNVGCPVPRRSVLVARSAVTSRHDALEPGSWYPQRCSSSTAPVLVQNRHTRIIP